MFLFELYCFYIVFGCRNVPCKIKFEKTNPIGGNIIIINVQGFRTISIIGTIEKFIEK
jgi:hypothetical protein